MYSALISGDPLGRWARRVEDREAETFVPSSLPLPACFSTPPYSFLRSPVGISRGGKGRIMSYLTGSSFVSYDKERGRVKCKRQGD